MSCPVPASLARSRVTTYVFYDENDKYDAAESPVKSEEDSKQVILPVTVEEHDDGSVHKARLSRAGVVLESDVKEVSERENPCDYPSGCYLSSSGEAKDPGRADTVRVVVHEVCVWAQPDSTTNYCTIVIVYPHRTKSQASQKCD